MNSRGPCPMPKMHYYRHMRTDQDHPDDQFDDSDILKETCAMSGAG